MNISKIIRRLRTERGVTQEELAEHLGVSGQAVSKWELGDSFPDITLLPPLASYFGVTLDELLDMQSYYSRERFQELNSQINKYRDSGDLKKAAELCRESLKTFRGELDNEWMNLVGILTMTYQFSLRDGSPDTAAINEAIEIMERLYDDPTYWQVRPNIPQQLLHWYKELGQIEKAKDFAMKKLPRIMETSEYMLPRILPDGSELVDAERALISTCGFDIYMVISERAQRSKDSAERQKLWEKALELFDVLYDGETDSAFSFNVYPELSRAAAVNGDYDTALKYTELAVNATHNRRTVPEESENVKVALMDGPDGQKLAQVKRISRSLLLNGQETWTNVLIGGKVDLAAICEQFSYCKAYDPLRDNPRFIAAMERLNAINTVALSEEELTRLHAYFDEHGG